MKTLEKESTFITTPMTGLVNLSQSVLMMPLFFSVDSDYFQMLRRTGVSLGEAINSHKTKNTQFEIRWH